MSKRRKPTRLVLAGEAYVPVVLQVVQRDKGLPRELRLLGMDEKVKIEGGEDFVVVYGSEKVFAPN